MREKEFEQKWLHGNLTIEEFENEQIMYSVWQYYKAKIYIQRAIDALTNIIKRPGFILEKATYVQDRKFLLQIQKQINNPDVEFKVMGIFARKKDGQSIRRLQRLLLDDDKKMLASMWLLSDYSDVRNILPNDLLKKYSFEQYLKETNQQAIEEGGMIK